MSCVQAPCCGKLYVCRLCHDEQELHQLDRFKVQEVQCSQCLTVQQVWQSNATSAVAAQCNCDQQSHNLLMFQVQQTCEQCHLQFGEYYCDVCHLFDRDKKQYHCQACGICR